MNEAKGGENSREGGILASTYSNDLSGPVFPEHSSATGIASEKDPQRQGRQTLGKGMMGW